MRAPSPTRSEDPGTLEYCGGHPGLGERVPLREEGLWPELEVGQPESQGLELGVGLGVDTAETRETRGRAPSWPP